MSEGDNVLAGGARRHVLVGAAAAHHPGVALHPVPGDAAAVEDPRVGRGVRLVGGVQAGAVTVEGVRVLHRELAHAQQAALRARLVAELGLDLVPALRQVAVRADLAGRVPGDDLLVGHAEHEVAAGAVLQAELLGERVAAGGLPDLGRVQDRHQHLLGADAVHLLADDRLDAPQHAQADRHDRVEAGGELPDEAGADHEDVADRLRVGGGIAQGRPAAAGQAPRAAARGGGHGPLGCGGGLGHGGHSARPPAGRAPAGGLSARPSRRRGSAAPRTRPPSR